ncbi:MAG: 4-hydroxy-3-methylbut-2-enyl diphosphate reductase [Brevinematales bacterium]|nr:4-hydroxy-3-methylbut-2-enyl diphosphate reductase [Brevinematales bacterium]
MKILIPAHSGFCPGVKTAETGILQSRARTGETPIYVYGELIHNKRYIRHLEEQDIRTARDKNDIPAGAVAVIRTHGLDRKEEAELRERFEVIDLTCVTVKKLQELIGKYAAGGYYTVIAGKKEHPEVRGLISYAGECTVIEDELELVDFVDDIRGRNDISRILIVSQTTSPEELFRCVAETIRANLPESIAVEAVDSICRVTTLREERSLDLQKRADITFVIGDEKSSNSRKLYEALKRGSPATYFIESLDGIREIEAAGVELTPGMTALVVSSSSTPGFIEEEIKNYLKNI